MLKTFVAPSVTGLYARLNLPGFIPGAGITGAEGMAWLYLLFILLAGGAWLAWRAAKKVPEDAHSLPYFSGLAEERNGEVGFRGPMNVFEPARAANYYLAQYVGEGKITRAIDIISTAFLIVLVGGLL